MIANTNMERMIFSSVPLKVANSELRATSFLYNFDIHGIAFSTLITNRHFVEEQADLRKLDYTLKRKKQNVTFFLHLDDNRNVLVTLEVEWFLHSTLDLAFTPFTVISDQAFKQYNCKVFGVALSESLIPTQEVLSSLKPVENVLMVGYPSGLYDEAHNLPLVRKGITASHPKYDYNNKPIGLVDMACMPGSSGSPIFIADTGSYGNGDGSLSIGDRWLFIGVLHAGPSKYNVVKRKVLKEGKTELEPTDLISESDLNLGVYIKSNQLEEFHLLILASNPPSPKSV